MAAVQRGLVKPQVAEYVLVSDAHISDRPPSSCTGSYQADILDLLSQTVELARSRHAEAVVIAGDLFHCKAPSRTSHKLIMLLMSLFTGSPPVYVVPGNHDLQYDRQESLSETQPLGVLAKAGAVRLLAGWDLENYSGAMGDKPPLLYGVPWLQGYGAYTEASDVAVARALEVYRKTALVVTKSASPLVVTHAPLYPPGKELPYEFFPAGRWAEAMGGYGSVFYGHVHEPHGTYEVGGVTFCNNGALSRGSLHEYNLKRQVGATVWDDQAGYFTFVPLNARPASEVFRLQEHAQAMTISARLGEFLSAITSTSLGVVSTESVLEHFRNLDGIGAVEMGLIEELLAGAQLA